MAGKDAEDIWGNFRRGVKPLRRKKIALKTKPVEKKLRPTPAITFDPNGWQKKQPERVQIAITPTPKADGWQLDRGMIKNLRIGRVPLDARLDLHGLTQPAAYQRLHEFIAMTSKAGMRCVLVITGKSGILKQEAPRWLREPMLAQRIIGTETAAPRHGGNGALYIVLKRKPAKGL
jgi:DNA-nicking Smr family endonuclease